MLGFVDESIEALPIGPELKRALLVRVWGSAMRWLEVTTELLVATYAQERESLARGAFARRSETVHAIVAGEALHSDEASRILDYPMRRHHTAFVLWTDDTDPAADVLARLDSYARSFVDESKGSVFSPCLRARASCGRGSRISTAVSGRRSIVLGFRTFVSQWGRRVRDGGIRSQSSRGARRPARRGPFHGFAGRHRLRGRSGSLSAHRRSGRTPCAGGSGTEGLGGTDGVTSRIRNTVRVYYENNCTAAATAAALGLHKNTVRYRLDQAETLLGRSVDQRRLPTELALIALKSYGAAVLPNP
ncbi:hypothetical protein GCM10020255_033860 [Rhodococcus baikonurensis]